MEKVENAGYKYLHLFFQFLAQLSTKCSEWAIVITHRPSSVRLPFTLSYLHSSIYKYQPISTKLGQNIYDHKMSNEFDFGFNWTRTTRVFCPWMKKIAIFHLVYTLASTDINQSAPNLFKIYMTIRSRMSLILDLIGPERPEIFALELEKNCYIWLCLHSSIYNF